MAKIQPTKWQQRNGAYIGGLRMRVTDADYDYAYMRSVPYQYSKAMYRRMRQIKADHECDYLRTEYDCNGSSQVRIRIRRKGDKLIMYYRETLDL